MRLAQVLAVLPPVLHQGIDRLPPVLGWTTDL